MKTRSCKGVNDEINFSAFTFNTTAAALWIVTTRRLMSTYGILFFISRCNAGNSIQIENINNVFLNTHTETVLKMGLTGISPNTAVFCNNKKEIGFDLKQSFNEQQEKQHYNTQLLLPDVLLTFMADMGITDPSKSLFLLGGVESLSAEQCCGLTSNKQRLSSLSSLRLITAMCINAIDKIAVEVLLSPAVVASVLCLQRKRAGYNNNNDDSDDDTTTGTNTTTTTTTTISNNNNYNYYSGNTSGNEYEELEEKSKNNNDVTNSGGKPPLGYKPILRFFLLSPYAPYAAVCEVLKKKNGTIHLFSSCGEACDVFLVYTCRKTFFGATGAQVVNSEPEVWGRIRHCCEINNKSNALSSLPSAKSVEQPNDEFFFIAANVADYLRLGAALSWVYGWQLCYAPQGPPARSLPWLKLFSSSALLAALSTSL